MAFIHICFIILLLTAIVMSDERERKKAMMGRQGEDHNQYIWTTTPKPTTTRDPEILNSAEMKNLATPPKKEITDVKLTITGLTEAIATLLPPAVSLENYCDYYIVFCMRAHDTGRICARSIHFAYHEFKNYCSLEYVNCMEGNNVWEIAHMGGCLEVPLIDLEFNAYYTYTNDNHLDQYYVLNDW